MKIGFGGSLFILGCGLIAMVTVDSHARGEGPEHSARNSGTFQIVDCWMQENGESRSLNLALAVKNGRHDSVVGSYAIEGHESATAKVSGNVLLITRDAHGQTLLSLQKGGFRFSSDSEGGEALLATREIRIGQTFVDTGTRLGSVSGCVTSNAALLERLVHND